MTMGYVRFKAVRGFQSVSFVRDVEMFTFLSVIVKKKKNSTESGSCLKLKKETCSCSY